MLRLMPLLFRHEFNYQYGSFRRFLWQTISVYLALLAYWFASSALEGVKNTSLDWQASSYFEFVVIGELALLLPVSLVAATGRAVRFLAAEHLLEDLMLTNLGLGRALASVALTYLLRDFAQIALTLGLAVVSFGLRLDTGSLLMAVLLILFSLPCYLGLGLAGAGILLRWGRGEGVISQLLHLATVFAGVYFPLTVLPSSAMGVLRWASPFSCLVLSTRGLIFSGDLRGEFLFANLVLWNIIGLISGAVIFYFCTGAVLRRGLPNLSHY